MQQKINSKALYTRCCSVASSKSLCSSTVGRRRHKLPHSDTVCRVRAVSQANTATLPEQAVKNCMPSDAARRALSGVAKEQLSEVEASVVGQLPSWLTGSLLVNGGGDYSQMQHMFDGYALVSKVRLSGGKAWGSQRFLDTKAYQAFKKEGRVVIREFATIPQVSGWWAEVYELLKQLAGLMTNNPTFTDNASVSLQQLRPDGPGGTQLLMAMSETPAASYVLDPATLQTVKQVQYSDSVPGDLTTAHPSILSDGTFVNFSRSLPFGGFHIYKQDPHTLQRTEVAFVPDRRPLSPTWLHDFAATDNYVVLIEQPLYMSLASLLLNTPASHLFMNWRPEDEVKVHLVALDGSKAVKTFTCPSFFYFHVGNAFESDDGSTLHVDLAAFDNPQILLDMSLQPLVSPVVGPTGQLQQQVSKSYYKRLSIPLRKQSGGRIQEPEMLLTSQAHAATPQQQQQDPLGAFCEFPAINPSYRSRANRYVYCLSAVRPTNQGNALSKIDLQQGTTQTWHMPGATVGESVFVARPGSSVEDDGVVLAPGVSASGQSFMVVMDAASWTELARVELPYSTPYRFHGTWMPEV